MTHEEAIKILREVHDNALFSVRTALETICPELAESEDERIRKLLRKIVITANNGDLQILGDNDTKKCLAYLEKQKDKQNLIEKSLDSYITDPDGYLKDWSNAYDKGFEAAKELFVAQPEKYGLQKQKEQKPDDNQFPPLEGLDAIKAKYYDKGFKCGFDEGIDSVKPVEYLDKDKVYKIMTKLTELSTSQLIPINSPEYLKIHDITRDVRGLLDYPIEQKPAEWTLPKDFEEAVYKVANFISPFDSQEELRKVSHRFAEQLLSLAKKELDKPVEWSNEDKEAYDMCYDAIPKAWKTKSGKLLTEWLKDKLKSLPERFNIQPKQEWSQQDKRKLQKCIEVVERWEKDLDIAYTPYSSMLKSLRPSWKPSEEQMEALSQIVRQFKPDKELESLYNDLKKLL